MFSRKSLFVSTALAALAVPAAASAQDQAAAATTATASQEPAALADAATESEDPNVIVVTAEVFRTLGVGPFLRRSPTAHDEHG